MRVPGVLRLQLSENVEPLRGRTPEKGAAEIVRQAITGGRRVRKVPVDATEHVS